MMRRYTSAKGYVLVLHISLIKWPYLRMKRLANFRANIFIKKHLFQCLIPKMAINYIEILEFTNYSCSNYRKSMLTVDVIGNDDFLT